MELSVDQMELFLNGAYINGRNIKDDWKDYYGEEAPQEAMDDLHKIISDMKDVTDSFMRSQQKTIDHLRTRIK